MPGIPNRLTFAGALIAATAPATLFAQTMSEEPDQYGSPDSTVYTAPTDDELIVRGSVPEDLEGLPEGPDVEGFISARKNERVQITQPDGLDSVVSLSRATSIKASGGFLGLDRDRLTIGDLVNGIPVEVETVRWNGRLVATEMKLKQDDLKTARMIQTGTDQRFTINEEATEALRGRFADIDKYNVAQVSNVYFDTGEYALSPDARARLCQVAQTANQTENAQILVVGYTDSTGSYEINQELSERRAARVKNFLQQECNWEPYRMLTPTGMAASDPAADNMTEAGKAQNRRVAINVLTPKSSDGL